MLTVTFDLLVQFTASPSLSSSGFFPCDWSCLNHWQEVLHDQLLLLPLLFVS